MLYDRNTYCLQARPCIFQPGNFTCWDSEGVKGTSCSTPLFSVLSVGVGAVRHDISEVFECISSICYSGISCVGCSPGTFKLAASKATMCVIFVIK